MIKVGLLDTTVPGTPGSMARYRDQLTSAIGEFCGDEIEVATEFLGCDQSVLQRYPQRLRMWMRHFRIWNAARLRDVSKYDLVHLLDGSFGYVAKVVASGRVITTVHDVIPRLQMDGVFPEAPTVGRGAQWLVQKSLRSIAGSNLICADSQNTADDLGRFTDIAPEAVRVIPLAIEPELFSNAKSPPAENQVEKPFLLHLGNNGFYKNRVGAIEVFQRVQSDQNLRLLMAGPAPDEALLRHRQLTGMSDRIIFIENPDQQQLNDLYRTASVFLFPSRYEGFGWPPLEAMAARCPVISSDAGSLPEVVGEAGIVVKSGDYDSMARACEQLLQDKPYRDQLVNAGLERVELFSRQRLALRMRDAYQAVIASETGDDVG